MYTLLSGLYVAFTKKEEFNIVILGLDNAGKTTLLERVKATYNSGSKPLAPEKIGPTVGLNLGKVEVGAARLNFWDLGGQRELQGIWNNYYSECHGVIFVIDSTDTERIEEVQVALESVVSNELIEGVPVLILANKTDVDGALRVAQVKENLNTIISRLDARDSKVLAVSALRGEGEPVE
ncbi:ADP-ribosylation factor protein 1 [Irineochytrium annulatum]|nr:ADP-ribosylation factor protein 1 [Irineochytrium annulatum]